ncbi:Hypp9269 [Branchiostoma lanceolatum]|uniref:Hypp9269 protein n=1 Tax=Branchiostoma lanceolatum TaxID=7740 RepID=A0A8J9ZD51_BRALA|nr:Hypp9269 [Branchiostoma lanceolatum]
MAIHIILVVLSITVVSSSALQEENDLPDVVSHINLADVVSYKNQLLHEIEKTEMELKKLQSGQAQDEDEDVLQIKKRNSVLRSSGGVVSTFVHWGSKTCPGDGSLVYDGVTGGTHYSYYGGGTNLLCMPMTPIYQDAEAGSRSDRAYLYGSEYETSDFPPLSSLYNQDPPCAVCLIPRGTSIMLPAKESCPSGWTTEYTGYLMSAAHNNRGRNEFICVEKNAEFVPGTSASQDGALLYPVEGRCTNGGGIPCGPYVEGYELTCSVCSI